jgi:hypothetical protein
MEPWRGREGGEGTMGVQKKKRALRVQQPKTETKHKERGKITSSAT